MNASAVMVGLWERWCVTTLIVVLCAGGCAPAAPAPAAPAAEQEAAPAESADVQMLEIVATVEPVMIPGLQPTFVPYAPLSPAVLDSLVFELDQTSDPYTVNSLDAYISQDYVKNQINQQPVPVTLLIPPDAATQWWSVRGASLCPAQDYVVKSDTLDAINVSPGQATGIFTLQDTPMQAVVGADNGIYINEARVLGTAIEASDGTQVVPIDRPLMCPPPDLNPAVESNDPLTVVDPQSGLVLSDRPVNLEPGAMMAAVQMPFAKPMRDTVYLLQERNLLSGAAIATGRTVYLDGPGVTYLAPVSSQYVQDKFITEWAAGVTSLPIGAAVVLDDAGVATSYVVELDRSTDMLRVVLRGPNGETIESVPYEYTTGIESGQPPMTDIERGSKRCKACADGICITWGC